MRLKANYNMQCTPFFLCLCHAENVKIIRIIADTKPFFDIYKAVISARAIKEHLKFQLWIKFV